jgi:hypothetical protein
MERSLMRTTVEAIGMARHHHHPDGCMAGWEKKDRKKLEP